MADDPSSPPKFQVPECMADEQSFWCQLLVPETWAENFGRVPWALNLCYNRALYMTTKVDELTTRSCLTLPGH